MTSRLLKNEIGRPEKAHNLVRYHTSGHVLGPRIKTPRRSTVDIGLFDRPENVFQQPASVLSHKFVEQMESIDVSG